MSGEFATIESLQQSNQVRATQIETPFKGQIEFWEATDFPNSDPWSVMMRDVIRELAYIGLFDGRSFLEGGIGSAANPISAGPNISNVVGVDIDEWRLSLAKHNMDTHLNGIPRTLHSGDIVNFLRAQNYGFNGTAVFCLPQSKGVGLSLADVSNKDYGQERFDNHGLALNTAALQSMRAISEPKADVIIILSDRVSPEIKAEMFKYTGWEVQKTWNRMVQQDPDTDMEWMMQIEDGHTRFYDGDNKPLSLQNAEQRLKLAMSLNGGRIEDTRKILQEIGDVKHGLTVYHLKPAAKI